MVGGVDATAGLQKTSLGQKRQKPFFEGKNLVPRGTGYVCLDKADTVIDGYPLARILSAGYRKRRSTKWLEVPRANRTLRLRSLRLRSGQAGQGNLWRRASAA